MGVGRVSVRRGRSGPRPKNIVLVSWTESMMTMFITIMILTITTIKCNDDTDDEDDDYDDDDAGDATS
jgi:hypothetical protein